MAHDVLAREPEFFGESLALMRRRVGDAREHRLAG
jgi:hypothetical protein